MIASIRLAAQVVEGVVARARAGPVSADDLAVAVRALGHVERHHLVAEGGLGLAQHAVVVGAGLVELGDHDRARHPDRRRTRATARGCRRRRPRWRRSRTARSRRRAGRRAARRRSRRTRGCRSRLTLVPVVDQRGDGQRDRPAVGLLGSSKSQTVVPSRTDPARGIAPAAASSVSPGWSSRTRPGPTSTTLRIRSGLLAPRSWPAGLRALPLSAMVDTSVDAAGHAGTSSEATPLGRARKGLGETRSRCTAGVAADCDAGNASPLARMGSSEGLTGPETKS